MIGHTLSHYHIARPLGRGGMGVVYEAEDTRLQRKVAIKLLPDDVGRDPQAMERFFREARIVSSLSNPHICVLFDIGEHEGRQFHGDGAARWGAARGTSGTWTPTSRRGTGVDRANR